MSIFMNRTYDIQTRGGPLDGELREVPENTLGWPPPVNLPGIFHGGIYIRSEFSDSPRRVAIYEWVGYKKGTNEFLA